MDSLSNLGNSPCPIKSSSSQFLNNISQFLPIFVSTFIIRIPYPIFLQIKYSTYKVNNINTFSH